MPKKGSVKKEPHKKMNHTKKEPRLGYVGLGQARLSQVSLGQVKTVLSFAWFLFYDSFLVVPFCVIICWCDSFFAVPFLFSSLVVHFCQGSFFAFFSMVPFWWFLYGVIPFWRHSFLWFLFGVFPFCQVPFYVITFLRLLFLVSCCHRRMLVFLYKNAPTSFFQLRIAKI